MLKPDEKVRLDNFKAQYQSILGNIRIANSDLERVLTAKTEAEEAVTELTCRVSLLKSEVAELTERRDQVARETDSKLAVLAARSKELHELEVHTTETVASELKRLEDERRGLDAEIADRKADLADLEEQETVLADSVRILSKQVANSTEEVTTMTAQVSKMRREAASLLASLEEAETQHARRMKEMEEEIVAIQTRIKEESDKIVIADEFISKKEAELARRERDVQVVTRRLKDLYNEVKPGTALKI